MVLIIGTAGTDPVGMQVLAGTDGAVASGMLVLDGAEALAEVSTIHSGIHFGTLSGVQVGAGMPDLAGTLGAGMAGEVASLATPGVLHMADSTIGPCMLSATTDTEETSLDQRELRGVERSVHPEDLPEELQQSPMNEPTQEVMHVNNGTT